MTDNYKEYKPESLEGKTPAEVADLIVVWREDDGDEEPMGHAFDLLNDIETYLRGLNESVTAVSV